MKVRAVVNRAGGSAGAEAADRLGELFAAHGVAARIELAAPDRLEDAFRRALGAGDDEIVVAAGGDGTIGTAAGVLAGSDRPLGVIPLGTLNHFARDAVIPLDMERAVAAIAAGHDRRVDLGEVNGRIFINNSSVGLYPDMVRFRSELEAHRGRSRRMAMLGASLRALRSFRRRRLWIAVEGLARPLRTPLLFVGNNRYRVRLFSLLRREALDQGELCLYAMRASNRAHFLWSALRGVVGQLDQQRDFVAFYVREAEISSDMPALTLSLDGETVTMATPLRYRSLPGALRLIVPPEVER